jgi:hypothetical protein
MSEQDFDLRLERVLRADAERAVRPFDAVQVAMEAGHTPVVRRPFEWRPAGWPVIRLALIASLLLLAALATMWLVGSGSRRPALVEVGPSPSATGSPTTLATLKGLSGPWIADRPPTLSLGEGSGATRMLLFVDAGGGVVFVARPDDDSQLLPSFSSMEGADTVRFVSRAPTISVNSGGTTLRGCTTGEAGTYHLARSDDGLRLTLTAVDDPCPARAEVYDRTWVRSLGMPNTGGPGVVDAFDPLFTVDLPAGSYTTERSADHLTVVQAVPELQFLAWKNPQGWNDPCDLSKGRYPIEPGAAAFVDYFRQLQGFTVDSTNELVVDGHHAVRLVVHANPDVACSRPWEFQPKAETGTQTWFLSPGVTDSLVLVELADDTTLMFEVLPAPNGLEDQVIGSIRFLDRLPSSP